MSTKVYAADWWLKKTADGSIYKLSGILLLKCLTAGKWFSVRMADCTSASASSSVTALAILDRLRLNGRFIASEGRSCRSRK